MKLTKLSSLLGGKILIGSKVVSQEDANKGERKEDIWDLIKDVDIKVISSLFDTDDIYNDDASSSIIYIKDAKYLKQALLKKPKVLLVGKDIKIPEGKLAIQCKDAKKAFIKLLSLFKEDDKIRRGIDKTAILARDGLMLGKNISIMSYSVIEANVSIGDNTIIYPHCYIGSCVSIGANSVIYSGVKIYSRCQIGSNVIIKSNSVIGSDGFSYHSLGDGEHKRIDHLGIVKIGSSVEIGALVTIDRAIVGKTKIGDGTKIDNQVHIAHNSKIGKNCLIAGQSGLAGSVTLGDRVVLAGQVGIVDHAFVGSNSTVLAKSMVNKRVPEGVKVFGYPARPLAEAYKIYKSILRLPLLLSKLTKKGKRDFLR